jgi:hypothetical protein
MAERAAHLVDHVFPHVPVRQWVVSLPHRLRYVLAWDHALCRAVVGVYMRAVLGDLRRRARLQGVGDGRLSPRAHGARGSVGAAAVLPSCSGLDGTTHLRFDPIELLEVCHRRISGEPAAMLARW